MNGKIEDTLGVPIGTEFVRNFNIDTLAPVVSIVTTDSQDTLSGTGTIYQTFSEIWVRFNEDAADPADDSTLDDVTNPANYLLVRPGVNAQFKSSSCQAGPGGDDVMVPTGPVTYENGGGAGPFIAKIRFNNGANLPNGTYKLFICGTTSITDLAGNHLNGGADHQLTFTVLLRSGKANPATGFKAGVITALPEQPAEKAYTQQDSLWMEIPSLGVEFDITGVPLLTQGWDLTWLNRHVGWLEGTAFPTWNGNTVLTAHAYTSDGLPGPFAQLKDLSYGDTFLIHLDGQAYTYTVQSKSLVKATDTSLLNKHEEKDWVTLITCHQFDEKSKAYLYRWVVRAVLSNVTSEE